MSLDADVVRKVARLANIKLDEGRIAPLATELSAIISWIEQLAEVDTTDTEPMASAVAVSLPLRDDLVIDGGDASAVLSNAPNSRNGFFVVPKVVE